MHGDDKIAFGVLSLGEEVQSIAWTSEKWKSIQKSP